jgi:HEAT repeat protein
VILGDPGYGKTWLLRFEAHLLARTGSQRLREVQIGLDGLVVPVFLRLADVNKTTTAIEETVLDLVGQGHSAAFRDWLGKKLKTENCVLLLDAWDGVPVEVPRDGQPIEYKEHYRQRLGQRLQAFARDFRRPRLLLTTRDEGYIGPPIAGLQELVLLASDPPAVEAFVRVWFGTGSPAAEQVLGMFRDNHAVGGLARIPLMLTLMCRGVQAGTFRFPVVRRGDLYESCLRGLLRDWREEKEERVISDTDVDALLEVVGGVAFLLFFDDHEQFPESVLGEKLTGCLEVSSKALLPGGEAAAHLARFRRDGILIKAGLHRDADLLFLHRTFHEYLTARHLARQVNQTGWEGAAIGDQSSTKGKTLRGLVDRKAWLPSWQEVIILLAGQLDDPEPLLHSLATGKDDLFRHRLVLAVRCLPETSVKVRVRLTTVIDQITTAAFQFWWRQQRHGTTRFTRWFGSVPGILGQLNGRVKDTPLLELLEKRLRHWREDIRQTATRMVGDVGVAALTPGIRERLEELVFEGTSESKRFTAKRSMNRHAVLALVLSLMALAAVILYRAGVLDLQVVQAVVLVAVGGNYALYLLDRPNRRTVRKQGFEADVPAAESLGKLSSAGLPVALFDHLMAALRENDEMLPVASAFLDSVDRTAVSPEIVGRLADGLRSGNYFDLYKALHAVYWLGSAAAGPEVLQELARLLRVRRDHIHEHTVMVVSRLGTNAATPEILGGLLELVSDHSRVAENASWVFEELGIVAATRVGDGGLLDLFRVANVSMRSMALPVVAVQDSSTAIPQIRDQLAMLLSDPRDAIRAATARGLGKLGGGFGTPQIVDSLAGLLQDANHRVARAATEALIELDLMEQRPEVLDDLLRQLRDTPKHVAHVAGYFLNTSLPAAILDRLAELMSHPARDVREAAAQAAGKLGTRTATPGIRNGLATLLRDKDHRTRATAGSALLRISDVVLEPDNLARLIKLARKWSIRPALDDPSEEICALLMAAGKRFFQRSWGGWQVCDLDELANGE